jgi:CRP-like cAMP-binding protein
VGTWVAESRPSVFAADKELAAVLPLADLPEADKTCRVRTLHLTRSRNAWPSVAAEPDDDGAEAALFLVVHGLLSQRIIVGSGHAVELLGPGDVFRPLSSQRDRALVARTACTVHETTVLALLDREFFAHAAQWPQVAAALIDRAGGRSRALLARLAIADEPLIARRVHLVLWHLADRWGRVAPSGVILPLRLSCTLLGELVCARRESVSRALSGLEARDVVRRHDPGYLLRGEPPALATPRGHQPTGETVTAITRDKRHRASGHASGSAGLRTRVSAS